MRYLFRIVKANTAHTFSMSFTSIQSHLTNLKDFFHTHKKNTILLEKNNLERWVKLDNTKGLPAV